MLVLIIDVVDILGLKANAVFAANWNVYRPVSLLIQSSSIFFLPTFSSWFDTNNFDDVIKK